VLYVRNGRRARAAIDITGATGCRRRHRGFRPSPVKRPAWSMWCGNESLKQLRRPAVPSDGSEARDLDPLDNASL